MGNLNIPQVAAAQNQKEVTINAATNALDLALTATQTLNLSSADAVLTTAQYQSAIMFTAAGNTVARTVTLPAISRLVSIINLGTFALSVACGSGVVSVAAGKNVMVATDGTANGLAAIGGDTGTMPVSGAPTAKVGLTAIPGTPASWMPADAAPALDVTIGPNWSGKHTFSEATAPLTVTTGPTSLQALTATNASLTGSGSLLQVGSAKYGWDGNAYAVDLGAQATVYGDISGTLGFTSNLYYNGGWKYKKAGLGAQFTLLNGQFNFLFAPSGDAGGPASPLLRGILTKDGSMILWPDVGIGFQLNSGNPSTVSASDFAVARAGSNANVIVQGANLTLMDSVAATQTAFQHSGGQTELWQYNGTWRQILKVSTAGDVYITNKLFVGGTQVTVP